ncbi:MAG: hypothetical protein U9Q22_03720 [Candidatus Altiarchaeota archaeon]|nr:hypothetical protein [Candidatus Altiarchaeota archaeon]
MLPDQRLIYDKEYSTKPFLYCIIYHTSHQYLFKDRSTNMKTLGEIEGIIERYIDDDGGYLDWVSTNPTGFVVNCHRQPSPKYLILHKATCGTISTPKRSNWTTITYIKICSLDKKELETWAQREISGNLKPCQICNP